MKRHLLAFLLLLICSCTRPRCMPSIYRLWFVAGRGGTPAAVIVSSAVATAAVVSPQPIISARAPTAVPTTILISLPLPFAIIVPPGTVLGTSSVAAARALVSARRWTSFSVAVSVSVVISPARRRLPSR